MISSFFPSGLARRRRAKPEGKKEAGWDGALPRAAASAALLWATFLLPLRGAPTANEGMPPTPSQPIRSRGWVWRCRRLESRDGMGGVGNPGRRGAGRGGRDLRPLRGRGEMEIPIRGSSRCYDRPATFWQPAGLRKCATPAGSRGDWGRRSGGLHSRLRFAMARRVVATARLLSGNPLGCGASLGGAVGARGFSGGYLCPSSTAGHADWKSALQQTRCLRYAEGRRLSLEVPGGGARVGCPGARNSG